MKKILILLIIIAILITACGKEAIIPDQKPTTINSEPIVKETVLPSESPSETGTSTKTKYGLSADVKELVDKMNTITSLEYYYNQFVLSEPTRTFQVYLKGNRMKQVHRGKTGKQDPSELYDTIYLDLVAKTAEAYCEDENCNDRNEKMSAKYGDFLTQTPFDFVNSIKEGEIVGSAYVENTNTKIVQFTDAQGRKTKVWMSEYDGIPVKYELYDSNDGLLKKVEYRNAIKNAVKDSELEHQHIELYTK